MAACEQNVQESSSCSLHKAGFLRLFVVYTGIPSKSDVRPVEEETL